MMIKKICWRDVLNESAFYLVMMFGAYIGGLIVSIFLVLANMQLDLAENPILGFILDNPFTTPMIAAIVIPVGTAALRFVVKPITLASEKVEILANEVKESTNLSRGDRDNLWSAHHNLAGTVNAIADTANRANETAQSSQRISARTAEVLDRVEQRQDRYERDHNHGK